MKKNNLKVIAYIEKHGLKKLQKKYHINIKSHSLYPHILQLSYNQLKSPFSSPIVRECRNLIIEYDIKRTKIELICFGYKKFFNYGEKYNCQKMNEKEMKVYEKVDGCLIVMYNYQGKWEVSSSTLPDACGKIYGLKPEQSICELFWEVWKEMGYDLPKEKKNVYIFELFTRKNIILVRPKEDKIILTGCRNMKTMKEYFPEEIAEKNGWECVKRYHNIKSLEQCIVESKKLNPMKNEGFVLVDNDFNRLKIKSPSYVAIAKLSMKDDDMSIRCNNRRILNVIVTNDQDEFLCYFPKFEDLYKKLKKEYDEMCRYFEYQRTNSKTYNEFRDVISRKYNFKYFTNFYNKKNVSVKEWFKNINDIKVIESIMKIFYKNLYGKSVENSNNDQSCINKRLSVDIEELYCSLIIDEYEREKRNELLKELENIFQNDFPYCEMKLMNFGSSSTRTELKTSDFDMCLITNKDSITLYEVEEILINNGMKKMISYSNVKVPIIKFYDQKRKIQCDISLRNHFGVRKTDFINKYLEIDDRLRKVIIIVKYICKMRGINDSSKKYLNSFAFTLMIIFFFQITNPPVLPILSIDTEDLKKSVEFKKENKEGIGELLMNFFHFYSDEFDYDNCVISVRIGSNININESKIYKGNTPKHICIEDPFEPNDNCGRTVSKKTKERILFEFNRVYLMMKSNELLQDICIAPTVKQRKRKKWKKRK